jgi:glycosyltransferase involved in cell wall biosynthesis
VRSLLISKDIQPWGQPSGAMLRLNLIACTLAETGPVDLLFLDSVKEPQIPPSISPFARVEALLVPFVPAGADAAADSYVTRSTVIASQQEQLSAALADSHWVKNTRYDFVWYNRERTWLATRGIVSAATIVDMDDLEDVLLERWLDIGKTTSGLSHSAAQRAGMLRDIQWWHTVHDLAAKEADVLVFSSDHDRNRCGIGHGVTVSNTYEPPGAGARVRGGEEPLRILFQGRLDWPSNGDAAQWLVEEIAPAIRSKFPTLQIDLVGKPSPRILALSHHPGVHAHGFVPSMAPYLESADLMVAPIRVGSGSRIKILEAFANHIPVVATSIAAEGLACVNEVHLEIADTAADIARQCIRLLADESRRQQLAQSAYQLYCERYRASYAVESVRHAIAMTLSPGRV